MKRLSPGSHRAGVIGLMAVLAFAFAVEGSQPTHSHEDGQLGLYNAECPLAELSAVHIDAWAPAPLTIASPTPVALLVAITSSGWVPSPSLRDRKSVV